MLIAAVARLVGVQATTVGKWRRAFAAERMAGLEDAGWIGRPKADLILDDAERRQLQQWARQAKAAQFLALRATERAALRFAAFNIAPDRQSGARRTRRAPRL